jgi:hypothetical protein
MNRDDIFHGRGRRIAFAAGTGKYGATVMSSATLTDLTELFLSSATIALSAVASLPYVPRAILHGFIPAKKLLDIISFTA